MQKEIVDLRGIAEMFSVPLNTLRQQAARREFPGIIKRGKRVYVILSKYREWFYNGEIKSAGEGKQNP